MVSKVALETLRVNLSEVIEFVNGKGGSVLVTRWGHPLAMIVPIQKEPRPPMSFQPQEP